MAFGTTKMIPMTDFDHDRRRRGSLAVELGFPKEMDTELPLLMALAMRGGKIHFATEGGWLEEVLANTFQLNRAARDYSDPDRFRSKRKNAWRNHIQFVRNRLANQDLIDRSIPGEWKLTESGWKRVRAILKLS